MNLDLKELIAKLNPTCHTALEEAAGLCVAQTNYSVELEHLFLKLLVPPDTDIQRVLRYYDVDAAHVTSELTQEMEQLKRGNTRTPALSPYISQLLQEAWLLSSLHLTSNSIRSGSLLLAILEHEPLRAMIVESAPSLRHIPRNSLQEMIRELIHDSAEGKVPHAGQSREPTPEPNALQAGSPAAAAQMETGDQQSPTPALDQYTIDLTDRARKGKIDPIQGRDEEIRQIIDILMRRRQNNPILTGEAGVGKTAVVEGFAMRIAQGDVPPQLAEISVRTLDLGLLQAGAGIRGEFENRLKSVIAEVVKAIKPIILFIDEAHTMIGAGGQAGQGDAANLLKPALARGEMRTIAATTWSEYKKYFEKDPALARRFQVIRIEEPERDAAVKMLRGLTTTLEEHHEVRILDEAVRDAVELSDRYISGRQLPDKAISVLDTACARVAIGQNATPPGVEDAARRLQQIQVEINILKREQINPQAHLEQIEALTTESEQVTQAKESLEERWQDELALVQEIHELQANLDTAPANEDSDAPERQSRLGELVERLETLQGEDPLVPLCVDSHVVASVVSGWTGIPIGKVLTDEIATMLSLKAKLQERIVGQDQALDIISRRIRTSRANLDDPGKPIGVFLLVGPSGVGKTETALALADMLYGGERNIVLVNMSEYQEAHTVSGLKGSPPGYVGYGSGGVLTEAVRHAPHSVILLDEVEKAHQDVLELFYQIFDKGMLEDAEGVAVDFRNTLILLTSNVGAEWLTRELEEAPDVEETVEHLRPALLRYFKPALLGRLVVVPYYPLGESEMRQIVHLKLAKIRDRIAEQHRASLTYHDALVTAIMASCTDVGSGARNIDNILTHTLLPELSSEILERMSRGEVFRDIHLSLDGRGQFASDFSPQHVASAGESLDTDAASPGVAKGTTTPEPDGNCAVEARPWWQRWRP